MVRKLDQVVELKLRAERRLSELIQETMDHTGGGDRRTSIQSQVTPRPGVVSPGAGSSGCSLPFRFWRALSLFAACGPLANATSAPAPTAALQATEATVPASNADAITADEASAPRLLSGGRPCKEVPAASASLPSGSPLPISRAATIVSRPPCAFNFLTND